MRSLRVAAMDAGEATKIKAIKEAEAEVCHPRVARPSSAPRAVRSHARAPSRNNLTHDECVPLRCVLRWQASRTEIQAKASAEAMHLSGVGIARQRQAIMEGLRESVNAWGTEVDDVPPNQGASISAGRSAALRAWMPDPWPCDPCRDRRAHSLTVTLLPCASPLRLRSP